MEKILYPMIMRGYQPVIPLRRIATRRDPTAFEDVAHDMVADVATQLGQSTDHAVVVMRNAPAMGDSQLPLGHSCRLASSAPSAMALIFAQAMSG